MPPDPQAFLAALQQGAACQGGYQQGTVVDLREATGKTVYLIGDVHAKTRRIADIFAHANLYPQLENSQAVVVFLGDLFHREEAERAGEMVSSLETLYAVMDLKIRFPQSIYLLLGNHEFTRTARCKHGYFQGALFRMALEEQGLGEFYDAFIQASPLVVIHPRCVGVHAAPASCVSSIEELKSLPVLDADSQQLHPAVVQLTCHRHVSWSPWGEKAYNNYDVDDFLALCGVPDGHLFTGHTPLSRETGWEWPMGPRNTVIFAAGRELGYLQVNDDGFQFVRVGRSLAEDDDTILWDRSPNDFCAPGVRAECSHGYRRARITRFDKVALFPDVVYRFDYPNSPVNVHIGECQTLSLRHYRHLSAASQGYYALGFYLVGNENRQELLKLKRNNSLIVGGSSLCDGVRFCLPADEALLLSQWDEGTFEIRALVEGIFLDSEG